jgi:hypothetical protein
MMKLTNAMRTKIIDKILERIIRPHDIAFRRRENALALRLLKSRFGADVFDRCRALPEGWLPLQKHLCLDSMLISAFPRWSGTVVCWHLSRRRFNGNVELAEYAALPACVKDGWDAETVRGKNLNDLHALFADHAELEEQLYQLHTQLTATLAAYTTVENLSKSWPEGYAELPAEMLAQTGGLPAPRIADLNARIAALREAA